MSASSISAAVAAIGTSSHSVSSSTSTGRVSLRRLPYKPNPIKAPLKLKAFHKPNPIKTPLKLKAFHNYSPFSSLSRSSVFCFSTAFDRDELNQDEEEEDDDDDEEEEEEEEEEDEDDEEDEEEEEEEDDDDDEEEEDEEEEEEDEEEEDEDEDEEEEEEEEEEEDEEEDDEHSGIQETVSEAEEEQNEVLESGEAGRLYVGNLPFSMTSAQLSEIFAEAGRVDSVEMIYNKVTGRSRGFAFVTMGSVEEAKEAIRLFDGAQIGGRTAKVNFPEVPRGGEKEVMSPKIRSSNQGFVDSPHKIYAGNLSWNLTSRSLREAFQEQPGFLSAKVIFGRDTGRCRGFGFVTFSSAEELESSMNTMNGVEVEGRPLRLRLAEQGPPGSPPPAVENTLEDNPENSEMLSNVST